MTTWTEQDEIALADAERVVAQAILARNELSDRRLRAKYAAVREVLLSKTSWELLDLFARAQWDDESVFEELDDYDAGQLLVEEINRRRTASAHERIRLLKQDRGDA